MSDVKLERLVVNGGFKAQDKYVEMNRQLLLDRSNAGLQKYDTNLERHDLSAGEWAQHLIEELLDAANYAQKLKDMLSQVKIVPNVDTMEVSEDRPLTHATFEQRLTEQIEKQQLYMARVLGGRTEKILQERVYELEKQHEKDTLIIDNLLMVLKNAK